MIRTDRLGIEKVKGMGFSGIIVEGNYRFYNTVGFRTSSEYGIYPVSGYPMTDKRIRPYIGLTVADAKASVLERSDGASQRARRERERNEMQ